MGASPRPATQVERVRGTQSLVGVLARCWSRPGLIARELAWRWLYGLPALAIFAHAASHLPLAGLAELSHQEPAFAARSLAAWLLNAAPALARLAITVGLPLVVGWAVASGTGRTFVLRRLLTNAKVRLAPLCVLQLLRIVALVLSVALWLSLVRAAAMRMLYNPAPGAEPSPVVFAALLICLSLGSFVVWALWSWTFSIAAILMAAEGRGVVSAVAASLRQGRLTMQLVEINLVLGIVKLALIVLAMVFSAIPLPFEAQMSGTALHLWYLLVFVWYLAASDFFQVARLAAFLEFRQRGSSIR